MRHLEAVIKQLGLNGHCFTVNCEVQLQEALHMLMLDKGLTVYREYPIAGGRLDFYLPHTHMGIEVKIKGSPAAVERQCEGYLKDSMVHRLLLLSSKHSLALPPFLADKPTCTLILRRW